MTEPTPARVATVTLNPCIDSVTAVTRVRPDRKLRCDEPRRYPGGGGLNVARVLGRLGDDVHAFWSRAGAMGERLASLLAAEDVPATGIAGAGETRVNLVVQERDSDHQYRFGMPGPPLGDPALREWPRRLAALDPPASVYVLSGSLPPDASPAWYGDLIGGLPSGAQVVVDTRGDALRAALDVGVDVVKPNVAELAALAGRDLDGDAAVREEAIALVRREGARAVLVSLGRGGALLVTDEGATRLNAPAVRVRSKVGAGDSMVGGLAHGLARGWPLAEAARLAVAAGSAAVMTAGTELCAADEVWRQHAALREQEAGMPADS
jgi:6-phosphofructokinase 2